MIGIIQTVGNNNKYPLTEFCRREIFKKPQKIVRLIF